MAIGTTADFFEELIASEDMRLYVLGHVSERKYLKMEFKIS